MRRGFERGCRQDGCCTAADTSGKQQSLQEKPAQIAMLIYPGMTSLEGRARLMNPERFAHLNEVIGQKGQGNLERRK